MKIGKLNTKIKRNICIMMKEKKDLTLVIILQKNNNIVQQFSFNL